MRIKKKWGGRWPPFYDSSSLLVHFNYVTKPNILYNLKQKKKKKSTQEHLKHKYSSLNKKTCMPEHMANHKNFGKTRVFGRWEIIQINSQVTRSLDRNTPPSRRFYMCMCTYI